MSKIVLNRDGSYIHFPNWLKNKKETVSPKNENNSPGVNNIGPFTKVYDCKEINFPSDEKDWKNVKEIAQRSLKKFLLEIQKKEAMNKTTETEQTVTSKNSSIRENQVY